MPVSISFEFGEFESIERNDRTRISLVFARLCWEATGQSSWRYPVATPHSPANEDWFNHVVPALMYVRCLILAKRIVVSKFSMDAHSQSIFRAQPGMSLGTPVLQACDLPLAPADGFAASNQLSESRLTAFLDDCTRCVVSRVRAEESSPPGVETAQPKS